MSRSVARQFLDIVMTGLLIGSLLSVPVHCHLVEGHHSLFDIPDALAADDDRSAHRGHVEPASGSLPVPGMLWERLDTGVSAPAASVVAGDPTGPVFPVVQSMTMSMIATASVAVMVTGAALVVLVSLRMVWFRRAASLTAWSRPPTGLPPRLPLAIAAAS